MTVQAQAKWRDLGKSSGVDLAGRMFLAQTSFLLSQPAGTSTSLLARDHLIVCLLVLSSLVTELWTGCLRDANVIDSPLVYRSTASTRGFSFQVRHECLGQSFLRGIATTRFVCGGRGEGGKGFTYLMYPMNLVNDVFLTELTVVRKRPPQVAWKRIVN